MSIDRKDVFSPRLTLDDKFLINIMTGLYHGRMEGTECVTLLQTWVDSSFTRQSAEYSYKLLDEK